MRRMSVARAGEMRVRGIAVVAKLVLSFAAAAELSLSWFARVDYFGDGSIHIFLSVIRGSPLYAVS